jgi:hypothetical protein
VRNADLNDKKRNRDGEYPIKETLNPSCIIILSAVRSDRESSFVVFQAHSLHHL